MSSAETNRLERRASQRFELNLPVAIKCDERTLPGCAQNLSGRGIFFYTEASLPQGAVVEMTFVMPSEITLGDNMPVRCRGRVLRSAISCAGHSNGVAVAFDSYEYLPADRREPVAQFARVTAAAAGDGQAFAPTRAVSVS